MSVSLVKKAFSLAMEDLPSEKSSKDEKANKRKASALDLIPRHQKLVAMVGKKGKKVEKDLIRRREKLTVTDVRNELAQRRDPTEENIRKLLMFSRSSVDEVTRETILKRARTGRYVTRVHLQKKKGDKKDQQDNAEPQSVFTEEDFANFAKALETSGL